MYFQTKQNRNCLSHALYTASVSILCISSRTTNVINLIQWGTEREWNKELIEAWHGEQPYQSEKLIYGTDQVSMKPSDVDQNRACRKSKSFTWPGNIFIRNYASLREMHYNLSVCDRCRRVFSIARLRWSETYITLQYNPTIHIPNLSGSRILTSDAAKFFPFVTDQILSPTSKDQLKSEPLAILAQCASKKILCTSRRIISEKETHRGTIVTVKFVEHLARIVRCSWQDPCCPLAYDLDRSG